MHVKHNNKQRFALTKLAGLALLVAATSTQAANWEEFRGRSVPGTVVFVDEHSIEVEHDTLVKGWVKFEYAAPKRINGKVVTGRLTHRAVNCDTGRYWVMEDWLNVKNGDVIPLEIAGNAQEWQKTAPSSEAEMAQEALCYTTKSIFGEAWDTVKESYQSPKADSDEMNAMGSDTLQLLDVVPGPQDIKFQAWVGETALDSGKVSQRANQLIVTNEVINFVGWDKDLEIYQLENSLPLTSISKAALVRGGNYEQLKQIQLITTTGKTVISFSTGEDKLAEDVLAKLMKAGVKDFSTSSFVHGYRVTKP